PAAGRGWRRARRWGAGGGRMPGGQSQRELANRARQLRTGGAQRAAARARCLMAERPTVSSAPVRASGEAIRTLNRSLAEARDSQLAQVVAVVDAMPRRGPADELIAPFR